MAEALVATVRTPLTAAATHAALRDAIEHLGYSMPRAGRLILLAQVWLETGNGSASYCFNLAGIKHFTGDGHSFFSASTHEGSGPTQTTITATFRAYATLDDAADDYVALILHRFRGAWDRAMAADALGFVDALHAAGYFTDSVNSYAVGLMARLKALDSDIGPDTSPDLEAFAKESIEERVGDRVDYDPIDEG